MAARKSRDRCEVPGCDFSDLRALNLDHVEGVSPQPALRASGPTATPLNRARATGPAKLEVPAIPARQFW